MTKEEDTDLETRIENTMPGEKEHPEPITAPPKYSVVLRFWNTPQEIAVTDIVSCQNKFTKANYVKFLDTDGRLWDNVMQEDVLVIKNFPDKEDIEDFMRLKRETVELNKLISNKKPDMDDISIR